jgi:hypothetical protein
MDEFVLLTRVITVCNKVDDVNPAKHKQEPTMTAPALATYAVQGLDSFVARCG